MRDIPILAYVEVLRYQPRKLVIPALVWEPKADLLGWAQSARCSDSRSQICVSADKHNRVGFVQDQDLDQLHRDSNVCLLLFIVWIVLVASAAVDLLVLEPSQDRDDVGSAEALEVQPVSGRHAGSAMVQMHGKSGKVEDLLKCCPRSNHREIGGEERLEVKPLRGLTSKVIRCCAQGMIEIEAVNQEGGAIHIVPNKERPPGSQPGGGQPVQ